MRGIRLSLLAIVAVAVFVIMLAGCGRRGLINVNGEKIAKDEFYARLEQVPVQTVKGGRQVAVPAGQYVMEQLISEKLVQQLAKKENVQPTDDQIERKLSYLKRSTGGNFLVQLQQSGSTLQDWKRQMMIQQSVVNLVGKDAKVSDADVKKTYDQLIAKSAPGFVRPEAVFISVIITKTPDKINKAYKLLQGGQDFGTVAMQMSEDNTTAPGQGKVAWMPRNMPGIPEQIRAAGFSTDIGKYTKPFFVQDKKDSGWMIVRADRKRKASTEKYDDVKDLIKEQLASAKANKKSFDSELKAFIGESTIKINSERYAKIPEMMKKTAAMPVGAQPGKIGANAPAAKK